MDGHLIFLGSPLIDVTANVTIEFLHKYQLGTDNAYVLNDNNRHLFGELRPCSIKVGGSVTNTARIVRKLCPTHRVIYLGTVGNDFYGSVIKNELNKENLGENLSEVQGSTGRVAVLINHKSRTLVTDLGVSRSFHINENIHKLLEEQSLIYVSGFFLNVSVEIVCNLLQTQHSFVLNLGAPFLSEKFPKAMTQLYKKSNLIFGNESEHRAFASVNNITSTSLTELMVATNQKLGAASRVVVATRGGGAVVVVQGCDWWEFEVPPLEAELVVDTNGAGDAFAGGFLSRWVVGDTVANCVNCGIEVAGKIVQKLGFDVDGFE